MRCHATCVMGHAICGDSRPKHAFCHALLGHHLHFRKEHKRNIYFAELSIFSEKRLVDRSMADPDLHLNGGGGRSTMNVEFCEDNAGRSDFAPSFLQGQSFSRFQ